LKPEIFITRPLTDRVISAAADYFKVTVRSSTLPMSSEEMRKSLCNFDGILPTLGDLYSAAVFTAVPNPRAQILANFGVGYNHIDVAAAMQAGLLVSNTPGAVTDATADIAMTLILSTARRAGEGERMVRAGAWQGWHPTQMLGQPVTGRKVGIIGMGRIGKAIAKRCHYGFGMEIVFHNRSTVKDLDFPATQVPLQEAMAADFAVVAVPGGGVNGHLINALAFAAMKPNGIFINIARGDVVDETALIEALQSGHIAGAGLDVYEREPNVPAALVAMENVTLFPHLGTSVSEVRDAMGLMAVENLAAHFNQETPPNLV
jgi:lactate dehydrogenase-like 2-hydroxyacid dehydrogenase